MRVTNLGAAILSVYLDSASDLPQARAQSKPDPFAILSVGKSNKQTSAWKRTDAPVWEQGFTFLVGNPEHDTLQIRIVDQKTEKDIGQFSYILNTLLTKNDLQVVSQPFQLQKSGPTSKVNMSMSLKILKRSDKSGDVSGEIAGIQRQTSMQRQSSQHMQRQPSQGIIRQASQVSQAETIAEAKSIKLADFPKLAEMPNEFCSSVEPIVEKLATTTEFISNEAANVLNDELRHRQLSAQSSGSAAGLGRIQISLLYSVQRQRLSVTVHKIMWVENHDLEFPHCL